MVLTNKLPSDIMALMEKGEDVFCKFGQLLQLKTNITRIKYADFTELYVRSYGNPYFNTDLKGHPQSCDNFKELEFREKYAELYLYVEMDQTGNEAAFDAILTNSKLLGKNALSTVARLAATSNIAVTNYPNDGMNQFGKLYTDAFMIDLEQTVLNDLVLLAGQTNKTQNGLWKVTYKNDIYAPGKNYTAGTFLVDVAGPTFYQVLNNYTSVDIATDITDLNLEDIGATTFAPATAYAVNDYVFFEGNNDSYVVYKCSEAHTSSTFFNASKFNTHVDFSTHDWWEREIFGIQTNDWYISVTDGAVNANTNYEIRIPITKTSLIYGSYQGDLIDVVASFVLPVNVAGIIADQDIIEVLSARVKVLYNSKWFPPKWLVT
jgi:hypothetical protein